MAATLEEELNEIFRHASWEDGRELHLPERKWEDVIGAIVGRINNAYKTGYEKGCEDERYGMREGYI